MKLSDYINEHYNGNKTAFANDASTTKQAIWAMVKNGNYYVYDGMLLLMRKEIDNERN